MISRTDDEHPPPTRPARPRPRLRRRPAATQRRDPGRTRAQILEAAIAEFAEKGLGGARVDAIAARAGANKRMLYHYFGNKEDLWLAALEQVYAAIRLKERALSLDHLPPAEAVAELVRVTWRHFVEHPEFLSLLASENLHEGRYLKRSTRIRELHSPLVQMLEQILARGVEAGVFRPGVDPVQLYVTVAALGYFYLSNRHTLATIFDVDLATPEALAAREAHIQEVVAGYLRP
jgi:AcrR family transcriptional regulator